MTPAISIPAIVKASQFRIAVNIVEAYRASIVTAAKAFHGARLVDAEHPEPG